MVFNSTLILKNHSKSTILLIFLNSLYHLINLKYFILFIQLHHFSILINKILVRF